MIHDLGQGGAEKVLVNLVNNMDPSKFDITVMTLFDTGVNKQFLSKKIKYKTCFSKVVPGNSHLMKLLTPRMLHEWLIKERYDIEISYLEGPSARIISGCPYKDTKLVCWIHIEQKTAVRAARSFRSVTEAASCYNMYNQIVAVSQTVKEDFQAILPIAVPVSVLYNTNETKQITKLSCESVDDVQFCANEINIIGVGKLLKNKGFDRLARVQKRLLEDGYKVHVYILGNGPEKDVLEKYASENNMSDKFTLLGYQLNPYKYVAKCDLFVCTSYAEGFSTAATEALVVGTPVCTVEVSGMREMLGNDEYGVITENTEEGLYKGIKKLLDEPKLLEYYKKKACERGLDFSTANTVHAVEEMLLSM